MPVVGIACVGYQSKGRFLIALALGMNPMQFSGSSKVGYGCKDGVYMSWVLAIRRCDPGEDEAPQLLHGFGIKRQISRSLNLSRNLYLYSKGEKTMDLAKTCYFKGFCGWRRGNAPFDIYAAAERRRSSSMSLFRDTLVIT